MTDGYHKYEAIQLTDINPNNPCRKGRYPYPPTSLLEDALLTIVGLRMTSADLLSSVWGEIQGSSAAGGYPLIC